MANNFDVLPKPSPYLVRPLGAHVIEMAQLDSNAMTPIGIGQFGAVALITPDNNLLQRRAREVTTYAAIGFGNAEIGEIMQISEDTVKTHLRRSFATLGIKSRSMLLHSCMIQANPVLTLVKPPVIGLDSISQREQEVMRAVATKPGNIEVADELCLSESTVKNHLTRISHRLGSGRRAVIAAAAVMSGLTGIELADKSQRQLLINRYQTLNRQSKKAYQIRFVEYPQFATSPTPPTA